MGDSSKTLEKEYKKSRARVADVMEDKAQKAQKRIMTIVAICSFIGTMMLLFSSDPKAQKQAQAKTVS